MCNLHTVQVSFVDSWLLSQKPVKWLLLRMMKKSNLIENTSGLQRQLVYSFGDNYYFRKELRILNLLTGYAIFAFFQLHFISLTSLTILLRNWSSKSFFCRYVFLLDKFGRIRWQGFGAATEEEISSLNSCVSLLLEEK